MGLTIRGAEGSLRWSYHQAATLRDWTVTLGDGVWSLTATLATHDAFRVSQRPLMFVAPVQGTMWRWPITSLQIEGASCSAVLGPQESPHVLSDASA